MDPKEVREQLAARLGTISGLTPHAYPPGTVTPPAGVMQPVNIEFDKTYGRGDDDMTLSAVMVGGKLFDRAAHELLDTWAMGSGPTSVKAVLESGTYTGFQVMRVTAADWQPVRFGGIDYLAVVFTVEISGSGS